MAEVAANRLETVVSLCKRRGFVFQSSEIYGGINAVYDFGPLGVRLRRRIRDLWWREMVDLRDDVEGLEAAILMNPTVWQASGHLANFSDPLVDCLGECHQRWRADHVQGDRCPNCGGPLSASRQFNLMFKTFIGPVEDESAVVYLRPETAQGIFVNFKNVLGTSRQRIPFGIAQIGRSFRNEISTGNFIFRLRELEMMELEWFCSPGDDGRWFEYWCTERVRWHERLGLKAEHLRLRPHGEGEMAHYALASSDIEYLFPWGWGELEGIARRSDYDLRRHQEVSGKDLQYTDPATGQRFLPFVVEPSLGVDRTFLALLLDAYDEEQVRGETRVVLHLSPQVAPFQVAVLPLSNKPELTEVARRVESELRRRFATEYDYTQSIGKRYRRQDEIGTPLAITVDFESLEDHAVTIRDRDSMEQVRVPLEHLEAVCAERLGE
ncbi:MAG: glycine--tRNA ligase [Candidatus Dormibacteria bacterium]